MFAYLYIPEGFLYRHTKVMQAESESNLFPSFIVSRDKKGSFQVSTPTDSSKLKLQNFLTGM